MQPEHVDPVELLERIRDDNRRLHWEPLAPSDQLSAWRRRPMRGEEALDYLHHHWVLPDRLDPRIAGRGVKGRLTSLVGRIAFRVLGPYLKEERELVSRLVQTCNALAERCDEMTREIEDRQVKEAESGARLVAWLDSIDARASRAVEAAD
jgi:hypothetical protein